MSKNKKPTDPKALKRQRDRFIAFAFASSDMFLEISQEGRVAYATGASVSITGFENEDILGKKWLELFSTYDQAQALNFFENARAGKRCGPVLVQLNENLSKRKALLSALRMPEDPNFYITLGFSNMLMGKLAGEMKRQMRGAILDRGRFIQHAQETMQVASSLGQDVDLTLFDFGRTEEIKEQFGDDWPRTMEAISDFLQTQSIDGQAAGCISEGRFSLIHEKDVDTKFIEERIQTIITDFDPTKEEYEFKFKTIESDLSKLSDKETDHAIVYTINEFDRSGLDSPIESLNSGYQSYASANEQRIKDFENLIERMDFSLYFQPVVDINTEEVSHYEILSRFDRGDTLEWLTFGEDIGMAPAFDGAVVERVMTHLKHKGATSNTKYSVNISSQSLLTKDFLEKLLEKLEVMPKLPERLMFEITDSGYLTDLGQFRSFISQLQDKGFKVALDDFDANTAAFHYLQKLPVDYVKLDGKFTRRLLTSRRDAAMVKTLAETCNDLNIGLIAETVEEKAQAEILKEMGVKYAQGYFYGKAENAPSFTPPKK